MSHHHQAKEKEIQDKELHQSQESKEQIKMVQRRNDERYMSKDQSLTTKWYEYVGEDERTNS